MTDVNPDKNFDNTEHIKELFSTVAKTTVDKVSAMMGWVIYNEYEKLRLYHLFLSIGKNKGKILDAGCGIGRNLDVYRKVGFSEIYGVDLSEEMVKLAGNTNPDVIFKASDLEHIPYEDNTFDCVISTYVLTHVCSDEKAKRIVSELERVSANRVIIGQCMDPERVAKGGYGLGGKLRYMKDFEEMFSHKVVEDRYVDWSVYSESAHDYSTCPAVWIPNVHRTSYLIMKEKE